MGLEQDYIPLSLLYVSSYYKKMGYNVYIKNLEIGDCLSYRGYEDRTKLFNTYLALVDKDDHPVWEELRRTIIEVDPSFVGITTMNAKLKSIQKIVSICRKLGKSVLLGGPGVTTSPSKYSPSPSIRKGILPILDYPMDLYDHLLDTYGPNAYGHMITSIGCPFKCKFCSSNTIHGRKVKFIDLDSVIDKINYIYNRFRPDMFHFWDETFTLKKSRVLEFCRRFPVKVGWRCDSRVDVLDKDIIKALKDAGCTQINVGIECGDDKLLKEIGKDITIDQIKRVTDMINDVGLSWNAYCIIGFPEETAEEMYKSLYFIQSLFPNRITLSSFTPYEGSELYERCRELDLIDNTFDPSLYSHQSSNNHFNIHTTKDEYDKIWIEISREVDKYNKNQDEYRK